MEKTQLQALELENSKLREELAKLKMQILSKPVQLADLHTDLISECKKRRDEISKKIKEKINEKTTHKPYEKINEKTNEKTNEKYNGKTPEKTAEKISEKSNPKIPLNKTPTKNFRQRTKSINTTLSMKNSKLQKYFKKQPTQKIPQKCLSKRSSLQNPLSKNTKLKNTQKVSLKAEKEEKLCDFLEKAYQEKRQKPNKSMNIGKLSEKKDFENTPISMKGSLLLSPHKYDHVEKSLEKVRNEIEAKKVLSPNEKNIEEPMITPRPLEEIPKPVPHPMKKIKKETGNKENV